MFLVVALNNPEKRYDNTPHNIGWESLLYFLKQYNYTYDDFKSNNKLKADILKTQLPDIEEKIIFARPQTYMNLSGQAVQLLANYYQIAIENIIILHDDMDFDLGSVKVMQNRNAAGHNGIKDIIQALNNKNFKRIRIGVKTELAEKMPRKKFVLHKFTKTEKENYETALKKASLGLKLLLAKDLETAQNQVNS